MHSFIAGWRLSLRRTRADWPIVAAAWFITLLATIMFAAGPIYSSAAALAGLRRTLADVPAVQSGVEVSLYGSPSEVAAADGEIDSEIVSALSPLPTSIVRFGRASATLRLPAAAGQERGDQAVLGFLDDLPGHAQLIAGAWPAATAAAGPLEVVLVDAAAAATGLAVGDELALQVPSVGTPIEVPIRLVGVFSINDPSDQYWDDDEQLTLGVVESGADRVVGPFLAAPEGVLENSALGSVFLRWRALPDFRGLTVDNVGGIRARLEALPRRVDDATPSNVRVESGLATILGNAERSLLVGRTQMLLLMAQLGIMAAYAIALTASLLVDHRRVETALLRSRGAGAGHIARLAFAEGLLLVIPSVLVAPWLAVWAALILNVAGPLAEIGLPIAPAVTTDSYMLAAVAGLICLAMLVLPAFLGARSFASESRELSRQETRTLGQRLGLDIALLVVSAIALWQLQLYGAPLTRTVQGSLGFDPLLVAAPAVGLLAGGILALRILPLLASALESWVSRGRDVIASLGSRQLARRPLRYTRTALLLILALSLGVFALSYAETWSSSQEDQATYQAGADVRAVAPSRPNSQPIVPATYAGLPGVEAVMPVERLQGAVSLASGRVDRLLAVDAASAPAVVRFRGDESVQPIDELMRALVDGRPAVEMASIPDGSTHLRIEPLLEIRDIVEFPEVYDPDAQPIPLDPDELTDVSVSATAIVRDGHGLLHRIESESVSFDDPGGAILLPLWDLDGSVHLAGLELEIGLPRNSVTSSARVGVAALQSGASENGPWSDLPLDGWAARMAPGTSVLQAVSAADTHEMSIELDGSGESILYGGSQAGRVLFVAGALDEFDAPVPVIANQAFLAATGIAAGETLDITLDGARRAVQIAGVVDAFPTTDPAQSLLVFDAPTLDLLRVEPAGAIRAPSEWWLAVAPDSSADVAAALRADPFGSPDVVSAQDRSRSLSTDPVALGIIGALLLGFIATGFFALVALVVSAAVSARQRRTEFALLRALGLSGGQLSRWLWLENGSLVLVSLVAGTIVGVVISWIALPFITVTQQAATPVPSVQVQMPWDRILMLDLVVLVALGIAVGILAVVLRRIGVGTILRMGED